QQIQSGIYGRPFSQLSNNGYINKSIANRFDSVKAKMSLVMGLDILSDYNEGHNDSAMLCASRAPEEGGPPNIPYSIDVIMENNAKIYPTAPKTRVLRLAPEHGSSFSWNKVNGKATRLPAQSS